MKIDWKLKGLNLLRFNCNKNSIVHPETCSDMVIMEHNGEKTLTEWISEGTTGIGSNLTEWLNTKYSEGVTVEIPYNQYAGATSGIELGYFGESGVDTDSTKRIYVPLGTTSAYGVIRAGSSFYTNNGTLELNVATNQNYGGIKIGYSSIGRVDSENNYPVLLDNGYAYVHIDDIVAESYLKEWNFVSSDKDYTDKYATIYNDNDSWSYNTFRIQDYSKIVDNIKAIYNTDVNNANFDNVYPIRVDGDGMLYSYIPITTYTLTRDSNLATNRLIFTHDATTEFINITPNNNVSHNGTSTGNKLVKWSSTGVVTDGPALGNSTTTYLRNDGTWDTPPNDDTTYEISTESTNNEVGGTLITTRDLTENDFGIAEPLTLQTDKEVLIPVVYGIYDNNNYHGVELSAIVNALINNSEVLNELKNALNS